METVEEKPMTVKELCEFLQISDSTVRRHLEDKEFPRLKIGNEYRFFKSQILKYCEERAKR